MFVSRLRIGRERASFSRERAMRVLLLGVSALALGFGMAACATPTERAANIADKCDAGAGYAEIAPPANAQVYLSAVGSVFAAQLSRRWPYETHWYRNSAENKTIVCNLAPSYNADRHGNRCIDNQVMVYYNETPSGPQEADEGGVICID